MKASTSKAVGKVSGWGVVPGEKAKSDTHVLTVPQPPLSLWAGMGWKLVNAVCA